MVFYGVLWGAAAVSGVVPAEPPEAVRIRDRPVAAGQKVLSGWHRAGPGPPRRAPVRPRPGTAPWAGTIPGTASVNSGRFGANSRPVRASSGQFEPIRTAHEPTAANFRSENSGATVWYRRKFLEPRLRLSNSARRRGADRKSTRL